MANCSLIRYLTNRQDRARFFFSQKCIRPSASNNQYLAWSRIAFKKTTVNILRIKTVERLK